MLTMPFTIAKYAIYDAQTDVSFLAVANVLCVNALRCRRLSRILQLQKVVHNGSPIGREHALGVELYAVDVKIFMPQSHYLSLVA